MRWFKDLERRRMLRKIGKEEKEKPVGGWILLGCAKGALFSGLIAWLFYQSMLGLICAPFCFVFMSVGERRRAIRKATEEEQQLFVEYLGFLKEALLVGYSLEQAVGEAKKGMLTMYKATTPFLRAVTKMQRKMQLGQPVETVFSQWAEEALCEDIREFSEVLYIAKRTGGVVQQVIADTEQVIREKQETLRYIRSVLHSREYETKVMKSMPFAMLAYLLMFMPDFLEPLYHNLTGICIMSVVLVAYAGLCIVVDKVVCISI